jgi:hypothetical protein
MWKLLITLRGLVRQRPRYPDASYTECSPSSSSRIKEHALTALREANSVYAIVTETVIVNGQARLKQRRIRMPQNTTIVEAQQLALEALEPALIRLRWVKKPQCRCPRPPYLVIKRLPWAPWFELGWCGLCMCEINDILHRLED